MRRTTLLLLLLLVALVLPLTAQPTDGGPAQPNTGGSPLSSPSEANEAGVMLLFSTIYGAFVRPILNWGVNRIQSIPNDVSSAIMGILTIALYLVLWVTLGGSKPEFPTDLWHWLSAALSAIGVGSLVSAGPPVVRAVQK